MLLSHLAHDEASCRSVLAAVEDCIAVRRADKDLRVPAVVLLVDDDGPGVPPDQRARILQRGERLDRQHPGQGIGLAVVKDIIESYGARLTLGDSPLGGAAFKIHFPAV